MINEQIKEALKRVNDPEIGMDIVTLELVRDIQVTDHKATVTMTLTSPHCPFGQSIVSQAQKEAESVEGISEAIVSLTFTPPWEPSQELRAILGV